MKTSVQQDLDSNIPKDVIDTREQAGRTLSYLATWYVIDRLNQVLGQGNWGYQTNVLNKVFEGEVEQRSGKVYATSYVATVALFATVHDKTVIFTEVGYGDGTDKANPGKAHELATKEAVSDALKRAAKNLGRSMGLALYDKTQEFVGTVEKSITDTKTTIGTGEYNKVSQSKNEPTPSNIGTKPGSNRPVKETVVAAAKILDAQKKITLDAFKVKYQKNVGISKLTDEQLTSILNQVKQDYPHLTLTGV